MREFLAWGIAVAKKRLVNFGLGGVFGTALAFVVAYFANWLSDGTLEERNSALVAHLAIRDITITELKARLNASHAQTHALRKQFSKYNLELKREYWKQTISYTESENRFASLAKWLEKNRAVYPSTAIVHEADIALNSYKKSKAVLVPPTLKTIRFATTEKLKEQETVIMKETQVSFLKPVTDGFSLIINGAPVTLAKGESAGFTNHKGEECEVTVIDFKRRKLVLEQVCVRI